MSVALMSGSSQSGIESRDLAFIREHRDGHDDLARLVPESLELGRRQGWFTMTDHGAPIDLPDLYGRLRALGEADPGLAWSAANSTMGGVVAARLCASDAADVLAAGGSGPFGFSLVPGGSLVDNGNDYVLSGSWPFVTGVDDCTVAVLAAMLADGSGMRLAMVDRADIQPGTNWDHANAMRSSGSNPATVDAAVIPKRRVVDLTAAPVHDHPLFAVPVSVYFSGCATAVVLGILASGLNGALETIASKVSSMDGSVAAEDDLTLAPIARARYALRAFELSFDEAIERCWNEVSDTGAVSEEARADAYVCFIGAVDTAREALSDLYSASTTVAWDRRHPVARANAEVHLISVAYQRYRLLANDGARVLMGLSPRNPRF